MKHCTLVLVEVAYRSGELPLIHWRGSTLVLQFIEYGKLKTGPTNVRWLESKALVNEFTYEVKLINRP